MSAAVDPTKVVTTGIFDPDIFDPDIFDIWRIVYRTNPAPRQRYDDDSASAKEAPRQPYADAVGKPILLAEDGDGG